MSFTTKVTEATASISLFASIPHNSQTQELRIEFLFKKQNIDGSLKELKAVRVPGVSVPVKSTRILPRYTCSVKIECSAEAVKFANIICSWLTAYSDDPYRLYANLLRYANELDDKKRPCTRAHYSALDRQGNVLESLYDSVANELIAERLLVRAMTRNEKILYWNSEIKFFKGSPTFDLKLEKNHYPRSKYFELPTAFCARDLNEFEAAMKSLALE